MTLRYINLLLTLTLTYNYFLPVARLAVEPELSASL